MNPFLSNSTIYYLIAIIYSDRITTQNMQSLFSSSIHFWWFATMNSVLSENMRCRMWDECDHCKLEPNVIFFHFSVLYQQLNKCKKSTDFSILTSVPHSMKTPLHLSYTIPLAENESLHCNFMLLRCRATFWRAHVMFVGTWNYDSLHITAHSPLSALFTRVKATE